ncbi:MAG TPA: BON domain-containing protein [Terriglobales bacterium]
MKTIESVVLMILLMPLGLAAQAPESAPKPTAAAQVPDTATKPDVAAQDVAPKSDAATQAEKSATDPATVSTSASASASFSPLPGDATTSSVIPAANTELQLEIQEALRRDPSLLKCSVIVAASGEGIDLTGNAASSRERLAVWRLAESYARGTKVVNHITVNPQAGSPTPASHPDNAPPASNPAPSSASPGGHDWR